MGDGGLTAASRLAPLANNEFHWDIPDGWQQGRGAYGGLVLAALMRAALWEQDPTRAARALSATLMAPVLPGEATLSVEVLRASSAVTTVAVRLVQGAELKAHAVVMLARDRASGREVNAPPPVLTPWQEVPVLEGLRPPIAPPMMQHWEIRALDPMPLSGGRVAAANVWLRPRVAWECTHAPELAALADVVWPTSFALDRVPGPIATIAFHLSFCSPMISLDPTVPVFHKSSMVAGNSGYFTEVRELWSGDGQLLTHNAQVLTWVK